MRHIRHWIGAALTSSLLVYLAGCATAPTKDEVATLDYGACPQNHERWVKERFQSGLLNVYAGGPMIWPPQKYWYRDPFVGSTLYAGYLVPVMADLTRGNRLFLGRQLYGFIFKNGEMIREINPNIMRTLTISEGVGPFPKDERAWKEGHSTTNTNPIVIEYVLPGETVQNWSELVTVQIVSNVPLDIDAARFVAEVEAQHKSKKPGCAIVAQKVLSSTPTSVLYEQSLVKCAPFRDEYSIRKAIRGPRSISEVSYAKTSELTDLEKKKWTEIVGNTRSPSECSRP